MSTQVMTTRLSSELVRNINSIAEERHRKPSAVLREAVEFYVAHWADYKVAVDRLNDPADKVISEKELLSSLGWDD